MVDRAQVVLSTCIGADVSALRGKTFDLCIIDEAAQSLECGCWIPIIKCSYLVLSGDHYQLSPTTRSEYAKTQPTMFERIHKILLNHNHNSVFMLTRQYRMNNVIQQWSSKEFYDGRLQADDTVANHLLVDLPGVRRTSDTIIPLIFIDTAECDIDEDPDHSDHHILQQMSKGNQGEAKIAARHVMRLIRAGVLPEHIAILTPYNRQVELCRKALDIDDIEIGTVDGFQGREKEAIIISLVRSNDENDVGFLSDQRRLNVAITRARRHLVVIADSSTISSLPFLKRFVSYLEAEADYRPATLYLNDELNDDDDDL